MNYVALALLQVITRVREARPVLRHERGQTLADFGLIITVALIGVTVAALVFFSSTLVGVAESATACFREAC